MFKEVFELFPYEYVHMGGDEVEKANWKKCPLCQKRIRTEKLGSVEELQAWFVRDMEKFFLANGKKLIGWDEVVSDGLSSDAAITWWRSWAKDALPTATAQKQKVIACPNEYFYFDYAQDQNSVKKILAYDPCADERLSPEQKKYIWGVQANLWAEWIPTMKRIEYLIVPRMIALSEIAWAEPTAKPGLEEFYRQLVPQFKRMDVMRVNYRVPDLQGFYKVNAFIDETAVDLTCPLPGTDRYTMAGSDAAMYAKTRNIPTELYTDADAFADLCAMKRDIYAGYLGFCTDGHGDIQWLTVYAADCTHDGYAIGVCEYCSAILEERHTTATGHNYVVSETPAADGRDGVRITTCQNCGDSSYTVLPGSGTAVEETHTVTGTVVLAADRAATKGTHAAIGADILLNGYTLATTDEKGNFSLQLKSGTYALTVRYAYGFSRTLYVVVSDRDLQCGSVPVIGCDWNKDGKIDDQDYYMFKLIFGTHQGQAGYLSYVDMNHDGMINTRDMIFVERCMGLQAGSFAYTPLVIR